MYQPEFTQKSCSTLQLNSSFHMSLVFRLLAVSTISFSSAMMVCFRVQANQFTCELPKAEAKTSQSYTGIVKGELRIDKTVVPLTHAYAIATDKMWEDARYLPGDKVPRREFSVILSDREISSDSLYKLLGKDEALTKGILDGRFKGLWFTLGETKKDGYKVIFLYPPNPGWGLSSFTEGFQSEDSLQITSNQIAGKISGFAPLMQNFAYNFSFKSPIQQHPISARVSKGQEALSTPPVKAYLAYVAALKQKNLNQMQRYLKDKNRLALNTLVSEIGQDKFFSELNSYLNVSREVNQTKDFRQLESLSSRLGKERYASLAALSPLLPVILNDQQNLGQRLHKVVTRGGESKIVLKVDPKAVELGTVSLLMTCENGSWKL